MIDDLTILLSTLTCLFVAYRAVKLDRIAPWFGDRPKRPRADVPVPGAATPAPDGERSTSWRERRIRQPRNARGTGRRGDGGEARGARG